MDEWKYYRNYEVSVWTLQDNYITTLKSGDPILVASGSAAAWPQARMQGQIQNGQMELNIDGTQTLSFDIPMYLYINGEKVENPNWYDAINENILTSMRKIKVIFNKWENLGNKKAMSESTFEFIILRVQETHEKDDLICHVECEGLAFHELGKVGYKRSLTTDEFNNEYYEWSIGEYESEEAKEAAKPIANLQYWMTKAKIDPVPKVSSAIDYDSINPTKWYYDIRMAHTSMYHTNTVYDDKIYEEGYATDWTNNNIPINYIETREMARLVDINESNLYNITQDLAEKFQIFCRYEYIYDSNYNIVGRIIVFYNNFLQEGEGVQTLMYPNSASKISREMDSTDVSTKMFVRSVDNDDLYTGSVNIMDCEANKSMEDYLLNFDYLHEIGTINDEQYEAIAQYEKDMRTLNKQIIPLQEAWGNLATLKTDVDAKVQVLSNSIELDEERITENGALLLALDQSDYEEDGYITRDYRNPEILALLKDSSNAEYDSYYIKLNQNEKSCGILPESIEIYKDYATTATKTYTYGMSFSAWAKGSYSSGSSIVIPNALGSEVSYELQYKGSYGTNGDVTSLPNASAENKGWVYRHVSNYNLYYSNGSNWVTVNAPSGYDNKMGFYIYTRERLKQINGPTSEVCTCIRKAANTNIDYISRIRRLYYTYSTANASAPAKPVSESASSDATTIVKYNTINEWSSFLSTPEKSTTMTIYSTWEIKYAYGKIEYTNVASISTDVAGVSISTAVSNAKDIYLAPADKLTGSYVYDEYGNLDKITGLFVTAKQGSYFNYGASSSISNITSGSNYDNINSIVSTLNSITTESSFPTNKKNKYVVIREQQQYSNGNIAYSYKIKYYNNDDITAAPTNTSTINSIVPIFYLSTGAAPSAPSASYNISNTKNLNVWTTVMPDKTATSQHYYSGWKVTRYNSNVEFYIKSGEDTSLKMKKTTNMNDDSEDIPKYVYAVFKYKPDLYYEKIKASWEQKLYDDNKDLEKNEERKAALDTLIDNIKETIDEKTAEQEELRLKFEHMMGAALRESYWQPEDEYQNYGTKYSEQLKLFNSNLYNADGATYFKNNTDVQFASIGWDGIKYAEEQELYYESSINKNKIYYPCIDLTKLTDNLNGQAISFISAYQTWAGSESKTNPFAFFFNPTTAIIPVGENEHDIRYCQYYTIGSRAKLAFVRNQTDVIPVLLLTDAYALSDAELTNLYKTARLGQLTPTKENGHIVLKMDNSTTYAIPDNAWINIYKSGNTISINSETYMSRYALVYPRIMIPSLKLKNNDLDLVIQYNNTKLNNYEDYYVLNNSYYQKNKTTMTNNNVSYYKYNYQELESIGVDNLSNTDNFINYYTITIKPEYMFANIDLSNIVFNVYFALSNADISIYLDAKKILKENAYPKVSYEIEVSKWSPTLLMYLYTKLAQLVMINDHELKLQETFGYISSINLDLDHEERDSIEVKNYKTKFEDLFSKIVAETEEMHKNSYNIGLAGAIASGDGVSAGLDKKGLNETLQNASNKVILEQFLSDYFDNAEILQERLKELWDEAGDILNSAAQSLNAITTTTTKNANILAGFKENITKALTPSVYYGNVQPSTFKPGDIWINDSESAIYVATGYSGSSMGGFTRTRDGKLSEISGASLNINAETGNVDIIAETQINLMSGKDVYIAAGDTVNIVGNREVNIGGTTINMASSVIHGDTYPDEVGQGGIHLVSTNYTYSNSVLTEDTNGTSRVDIDGNGIELASKNGITIKSGAGIDIKSSTSANVSALQIDNEKGIWVGSNKSISLFSGIANNGVGQTASGASVEISGEHILLGVLNATNNSSSATAIELSEKQIILAAGESIESIDDSGEITVLNSSIAGVQIKKDYIGMAAGSGNSRSIFSLKPGEIRLGTMSGSGDNPEDYTGNFLWLSKGDVYIGSDGNLTLNTNNIKIQTKLLSNATATASESAKQAVSKMGFVLGKNLNSTTTANREPKLGFWMDTSGNAHLTIDGDITANTFVASSSNGYFIAQGNKFGLYADSSGANEILTINNSGNINANGDLILSSNKNFKVDIQNTSNNNIIRQFTIDTSNLTANNSNPTLLMYTASSDGGWDNATSGLKFTTSGGLEVKGTITANALYIYDSTASAGNQYPDVTNWVNAKVTPEAIWLGVVRHTTGNSSATVGNSTSLEITDNKFEIKSTGQLKVTTSNVIINTNAGNNESIFKLTNGATNNPLNYFNLAKNSSGNIFAQIAGWQLEEHKLFSGTSSNYVGLDSGSIVNSTILPYAMWAGKVDPDDIFTGTTTTDNGSTYNVISTRGAPFRVTRDGRVYMDKLMLWDSEKNIYKEVDFSDFNQAVSISGRWNGTTYTATANYWGKFNKTASTSISLGTVYATVTTVEEGGICGGLAAITVSNPDGSYNFPSVDCSIDASKAYDSGITTGYTQAAIASSNPDQVTLDYDEVYTVTVPTVGMGGLSTGSVEITAPSDRYNEGWNAALAACGISGGGTVYTGGTYYQSLYTVGEHGDPHPVGSGRIGVSSHTVAAK